MYIIVFVCGGCGLELFRQLSGYFGLDPRRVVKLYGGRCPRCGKKLEVFADRLKSMMANMMVNRELEVSVGRLKFMTVKEYKPVSEQSDDSKVVSFKVSRHLDRIIEEVARRKGYSSKSDFIRDVIMDYLVRHGG